MPIKPKPVQPKDIIPPSVVIRHSPASPNTLQKVTFSARAADAGGISKVDIAVNGRIVKSCTSTPCTYEGGPYPVGSLNYGAYAYDKAGNKASAGSKSLTVNKPVLVPIKPLPVKPMEIPPVQPKDITPPSVGIRHNPASPYTTQKITFTASAKDVGGISKLEIAVDGKVVKSCTSVPCTYEGGPYPAGSLNYGAYAYDKAGNKASAGSKSLKVTRSFLMPIKPIPVKPKDIIPPSVGIRRSPASPNTLQKVTFSANAKDAGGISKVEIAVNGKVVKSCTSVPCTYEGGPYPAGSLGYGAYAYDKAGNKAFTGSKSLTVSKPVLMPIKRIPIQPIPRTIK
jgi:archaellum component FlaF (FlaF/FlaG flagellin family)